MREVRTCTSPSVSHKCHYCDFYSIVDSLDRQEAFVERIEEELSLVGPRIAEPLASVFIGGGTPTLLRIDLLARLLAVVGRHLPLAGECEWTVEANPETVDEAVACTLRAGGVTRASIGCQSFHPELLAMLERHHDPENVPRAVDHLRTAGFKSINLDLIMGIPGSSLEQWCEDLEAALALGPQHLSCYGLQYEPNTPLTKKLQLGRVQRIDDAIEASMYEHTCKRLTEAGVRTLRDQQLGPARRAVSPQHPVLAGRQLAGVRAECIRAPRWNALANHPAARLVARAVTLG